MNTWVKNSIFYHIYPLGFCGAPKNNDFTSENQPRLEQVLEWVGHIKYLGATAVYFGPLFESGSHGYDMVDYYKIDRRLGNNDTFAKVSRMLHEQKIRVVVDGVFNHVGRDFWAFKDVLRNGRNSRYCQWFSNLRFEGKSTYDDPFSYEGWNGYFELVKLNVNNPEVKDHIFRAVKLWIEVFDIDGIRLDCADCLDFSFLSELSRFCRSIKPDMWLLGEVIHGDYNRWANENTIDSVTNYECYKGLYSSHNDKNYFEIAYTLNRQFGEQHGIYKNLSLYAFADNHDVNRIGSTLKNPMHLYPLHAILFTMPGIPSIYYGSEWGIEGRKSSTSDEELRPKLDLSIVSVNSPNKDLANFISALASIRNASEALRQGAYKQLAVKHEQFAFARMTGSECMIVVVNAAQQPYYIEIDIPVDGHRLIDLLNHEEVFYIKDRKCYVTCCYPYWTRILRVEL